MTRVLVVGGFDPSGAGVDADRSALAALDVTRLDVTALDVTALDATALDVTALVVVTARTDQDDRGVRSIGALEPRAWLESALAHVEDGVDAIKMGLLPGAEHVRAAVQLVRAARARQRDLDVVVDPVIAASSGTRFLDDDAVEVLRGELLGEDVIVTPNIAEAAELAGLDPARVAASMHARLDAAEMLIGLGARAVIVKGGHGSEDPVRDLVLERDRTPLLAEHARVPGGKIRGSGCRYATRVAARLAQSWTLEDAARDAAAHVSAAIAAACRP